MSRLTDLSRALTGGIPVQSPLVVPPVDPRPAVSGPVARAAPPAPEPIPPPGAPAAVPLPSVPLPTTQPKVLLHRNQTRYLQAIQPDGSIRSQSLSAWSLELGLPAATLRWRVRAGWSDAEVLGQVEHPRDRQQEQAASALEATNVVVVEEGRIVGRSEAARRLGIKKASLVYRLRQYRRPDGRQAEVSFVSLAERSRQIPRD